MITLTAQPSLNELYGLINKVPRYPLSIQRLLRLAKEVGAPKEVVSFYKVFADDQVFDNEDDLAGRTEQIQIMLSEDLPTEVQLIPEED
jgi:hypothetical protein